MQNKEPLVVLVDENDREIGAMPKQEAHEKGLLHRAFSILIYDKEDRLLLQQRHPAKYHSGGLWTNTCCSHPVPGEAVSDAAVRRLKEEMGFSAPLESVGSFIYRCTFGNGLTEFELDHVFTGRYDGTAQPDVEEVSATRWIAGEQLRKEMNEYPETFTYWFRELYQRGFCR